MTDILEQLLKNTRKSSKQTDALKRIDSAAIELFAERGFSNTSSKAIAERANVSEGTIFKHYQTKPNLLIHILLKFLIKLQPKLTEEFLSEVGSVENQTLEQFINTLLDNRFDYIKKNQKLFSVLIKELLYDDNLRNQLIDGQIKKIRSILYGIFDQIRKNDNLEGYSNQFLLDRFISIFFFGFVKIFVLTDDYKTADKTELCNSLKEQFFRGISYD